MGALVGDLSADVAQCGYFGSKNGHVLWGQCPAGGGVEKIEKNEKKFFKKNKKLKIPKDSFDFHHYQSSQRVNITQGQHNG